MSKHRWLWAILFAVALAPGSLLAQEPAVITGTVTGETGEPVTAATVSIRTLNVGTQTGEDGTYRLVVPASRVTAAVAEVPLTATRAGFSSSTVNVQLSPGAAIIQNFSLGTDVLQLEGIVATGQGTQTTRERTVTAISTVQAEEIQQSNETNVVAALSAKAPGVQVVSSSGDPGAGAYIRIRGAASIVAGTQPLFVVDGTPVDNSSNAIEGTTGGTAVTNRAADINPNDIQRVEILKGAAATAIYGSRGANGVVLITTKGGQAGSTRATLSSSFGYDEVTQTVPLQQQFSQGLNFLAFIPTYGTIEELNADFDTDFASFDEARAAFADQELRSTVSFGAPVPDSVATFDHANEIYDAGLRLENNLTISGGGDRTTYYLGVGRSDHDGVIDGNQSYDRTSVRLKGSHFFADDLQATGNISFAKSEGDLIQQGSNTSGIQLAALRTPPEFDNCIPETCYLTPAGLQRSYRRPTPTSATQSSGYDNPFFIANENLNQTDVGRTFGNVGLDYAPTTWLKLNYTLGADYLSDERFTFFPQSSAGAVLGEVITSNFVKYIIDSNLTATASGSLSDRIVGSITLGQNLNQEEYSRNLTTGTNLIAGTQQPDFAVDRITNEYEYTVRTDGYFASGEATLSDQLTLTATGRFDGSSTFGRGGERFFYPSVGASWVFSKLSAFDDATFLDFAKVRGSWGEAGRQPPVFSNISGFTTLALGDGYVDTGLSPIFGGRTGVVRQGTLGNPDIEPEVKEEWEVGLDMAFFQQRASLGVTYYNNQTTNVILDVPIAPSRGFFEQTQNAAEFEADGWEVTLDVVPVQSDNFSWSIGAQYTQNNSCVTDLAGAESVFLSGFTGSTVSLIGPDGAGTTGCNPFGVFFGGDFVRFGRGIRLDIDGNGIAEEDENIDLLHPGAAEGALYIAEGGFPLLDDAERVVGDPNPDWQGAVRSSVTLFDNLRVSGLLDIKQGGDVWNGTKGALYFFGTHEGTLPFQGEGMTAAFGEFELPNGNAPAVDGPGVGTEVPLNWATWTVGGLGSGFTGPFSQFVEDGSYVKLRDISVSYTLEQPWIERAGFNTIDLTVSGRNLKTWTDYTGIDPESNLTAQSTARGLDYFNNPQTRSFIFTVNLNR